MSSVQFFCAGNPVQQGNLRTNPSGISYHTDKGLKEWRQMVAMTARSHFAALVPGAVRLKVYFFMPRTKAMRAKTIPHTKRPDLDKLLRGVLDAMTGVVYGDDSAVTHVSLLKRYALPDEQPGVLIKVLWEDGES